jgi:type I restriction enzyme M protein
LARFDHDDYKGKLNNKDKDFPKENKQFDVIVSNPPYSVSAFRNNASKFYNQNEFDLYDKLTDNSSEIECLFIERTKQLLKDGGVAGIILPSSILSNTGIYTKSREIILQYFDVYAIAELGGNTFMEAKGISTVTLFLRRRNNYDCEKIRTYVNRFFTDFIDNTVRINEQTVPVEKPVAKYVNHVWEGVSVDDYISLLKKAPNKVIIEHEIYIEYKKKLKAKNDKEFWGLLLEKEADKLYYFIIAYPQKIVLVKSGEKDAEKRFLGYDFSGRRGNEGIHPIQRGKNIEDCTQMFDPEIFDNPAKASTYIYKAFSGDYDFPIDAVMQNNISRHRLVDMFTFNRVDFEKNISLSVKKKVKIESKWELVKISETLKTLESGKRPQGGVSEYQDGIPSLGGEHINLNGTVSLNNMKFVPEDYYNQASQGFLKDLDILICKDGALTGKTSLFIKKDFPFEKGMINEHIFLLRTNKRAIQKYLFNILYSNLGQELLKLNVTGTAQGGLNRDNLLNIQIPLPPLNIQEKIVAELEVLEKKEDKVKREIEKLKNEISQTVNDIKGEKKKIGVLCQYSTQRIQGALLTSENYVGVDNMLQQTMGKVNSDFVPNSGLVTKYNVGDILLSNIRPYLKKIWFADIEGGASNDVLVLQKTSQEIVEKYLFYNLKQDEFFDYEMQGKKGLKMPRGDKNQILNYQIPVPTLSEQKKIVSEIEKIETKLKALENEIASIPQQKEAILKKHL